ncbi:MAG: efflux RND transporter periplasmic adaptor subunit [Methyloglobulus sp.]|nr:efflux RND transporter periplasmic adaptor subunit [Methyloglobulus sp.]
MAWNSVFCPFAVADEPIPVLTQPLNELALYPESTAAAQVVSLNDTAIAAQVNGLVAEVPVRVGDTVKAGAVLVKLDCKDFELERTRIKAEKQAIQARLELAQWQLKQSELLASQQTLPVEKVQQRRSELTVLRSDLAAHAARIETTRRQIAHCNVKAPFAGVVTARSTAVGQLVSSGTVLVHLLDLTRAEVSAQVSSRDITALREAGELSFEHEGQRYPLKLRAVLPTIQTQTGTQEVRLDFSGKRDQPGAAGHLVWQDQVLHIASSQLVKRGEQLGVFTEQSGVAHFHPLPDAQNGRPAVIDLSPDTPIIVSGQYSLNEGSRVKAQASTETKSANKAKP